MAPLLARMCTQLFFSVILIFSKLYTLCFFLGTKKHAFQTGVLFRSSYFFSALSVHSFKTVPLKIIIFGYF